MEIQMYEQRGGGVMLAVVVGSGTKNKRLYDTW